MTETEVLAVRSLIDALEEAHQNRDDKRFDQVARSARNLLLTELRLQSLSMGQADWCGRFNIRKSFSGLLHGR